MKQGFTLIELLAVIVILAIIALIATPIVLNIIANTKENAQLRSAEMYLDAVEQAISIERMNNTTFKPNSCNINNGDLECEGYDKNPIEVEVNGEKPNNGRITFTEGKITQVELKYQNGKTIAMNNKSDLEYNEETSEGSGSETLAAGVLFTDGSFVPWDDLSNQYYFVTNGYQFTLSGMDIGENVKAVSVPETITSINPMSFDGDFPGLETVYILGENTSIIDESFSTCPNLTTIYYSGDITDAPWGATNATVVAE